jgi:hypothetical protein
MTYIEWDDGDDGGSVECAPAKDVEVNELGVWLPGRLLNAGLATIPKSIRIDCRLKF